MVALLLHSFPGLAPPPSTTPPPPPCLPPRRSTGLDYAKCPFPKACLPGMNGTRSMCASGFQAIACSACAAGYFLQFQQCQRCPPTKGVSVAATIGVIACAVVLGYLLFRVRSVLPTDVIRIGLSTVQIFAAVSGGKTCFC